MYKVDIENSQSLQKGIDVSKLKPGTMLLVVTRNNLYKIIKQDADRTITVQGGKYFLKPTTVFLTGSTLLGSTMLKLGWISYGMKIEMWQGNKKFTTSAVKAAKIVGDGWEYDMDWEDQIPKTRIDENEQAYQSDD